MKPATAANLSLVLAFLAWPCCLLGVSLLLGDVWTVPDHRADSPEMLAFQAQTQRGLWLLQAAIALVAGATWLSGRAWQGARKRALAVLAIWLLPPVFYACVVMSR